MYRHVAKIIITCIPFLPVTMIVLIRYFRLKSSCHHCGWPDSAVATLHVEHRSPSPWYVFCPSNDLSPEQLSQPPVSGADMVAIPET